MVADEQESVTIISRTNWKLKEAKSYVSLLLKISGSFVRLQILNVICALQNVTRQLDCRTLSELFRADSLLSQYCASMAGSGEK